MNTLPTVIVSWRADPRWDRLIINAARRNDEEGLRKINQSRDMAQRLWLSFVEKWRGEFISVENAGGRIRVTAEALDEIEPLRIQYGSALGLQVRASVGIGMDMSESQLALQYAQGSGGDSTVLYTEDIPEELSNLNKSLRKDQPAENSHAGGGGFVGFAEPGQPARPLKAIAEASEHSEGEAAAAAEENAHPAEGTHSARDFEEFFHGAAREQDDKDHKAQAVEQKQSQAKAQVVQVLQQVKQMAPQLEQLQQAAPPVYQAIKALISTVIFTGKELLADRQAAQPPQEQVAKSEKEEKEEDEDLTDEEKAKKAEELAKGKLPMPETITRHRANFAVGTTKHAGPQGTKEAGKVKVTHDDDGKTAWVSVRAGQVLSQDGHPISSRNPDGR